MLQVPCTRILGRVVKALDLSPSGHSPREFEPRRMQWLTVLVRGRDHGWIGGRARSLRSVKGVAGVMVSIVAFQAVDPGSIPGPRRLFALCGGGEMGNAASSAMVWRACLA